MVQVVSLDDMYSENIWFSGSKPSNDRGKLRCHACDIRTDGGKLKIGQCSELNQKPQKVFNRLCFKSSAENRCHCSLWIS